jgi:hypothetical protein
MVCFTKNNQCHLQNTDHPKQQRRRQATEDERKTSHRRREESVILKNDNTKNVTLCKLPEQPLFWDSFVTLIKQGENHTTEKWYLKKPECHIKLLGNGLYQVKKTGEVKEMAPKTDKKTMHHLRGTFEDLRRVIRTNFTNEGQNQSLFTLTYDPIHTGARNPYQAYDDFVLFWKRLKHHLKGHKLEYISVIEPQASGNWHFHVMVKSDQKDLWIKKERLGEIWGLGDTRVERLKSDDIGAYYVSYFTHMYEEEAGPEGKLTPTRIADLAMASAEYEKAIHDTDNPDRMKLLKKSKIKGARLKYYPKDLKFYRCSRGILRPEVIKTIHAETENGNLGKKVYSKTVGITDDEGEIIQIIQTTQYKKNGTYKRKGAYKTKEPKQ